MSEIDVIQVPLRTIPYLRSPHSAPREQIEVWKRSQAVKEFTGTEKYKK